MIASNRGLVPEAIQVNKGLVLFTCQRYMHYINQNKLLLLHLQRTSLLHYMTCYLSVFPTCCSFCIYFIAFYWQLETQLIKSLSQIR